jgi:hypothetical protein
MRANLKDNLIAGIVMLLLGGCLTFAVSIENRLDAIEKHLIAIDAQLPTKASLARTE